MKAHLRANLLLLVSTLVVCSMAYPLAVWAVGRTVFAGKSRGSLVDKTGRPAASESDAVGSRLIAQPFAGDEYFRPRPSAVSYNGAGSGGSNLGASNYALRERVARQLGPIVKHRGGEKKGRLVAPDIEAWFRADRHAGKPGIVAQWARAHSGSAAAWVKADALNAEFVDAWSKAHPSEAADLAVAFFVAYSAAHPGTFPGVVEFRSADGKAGKRVEPLREGGDIVAFFFEMWRDDNPQVDLEPVPADMVMASGSGLDPHITLSNARYQLDRVAGQWATKTRRDAATVRAEIEAMLAERAESPLAGLVGVELINVLDFNLALRSRYGE